MPTRTILRFSFVPFIATVAITAFGFQGDKRSATMTDETTIKLSLHQFFVDCDRLPTQKEGLAALRLCPAGLEKKWRGPYITRMPLDPWGSPYAYKFKKGKFTVTSFGSDRKPGGKKGTDAEDIAISGV